MRLAEFRHDIRKARQSWEWQFTFALWALLAGAGVVLRGQSEWGWIVVGVFVFLLHTFWIGWHCYRANTDAHIMYGMFDLARRELFPDAPLTTGKAPGPLAFLRHPPTLFALSVTAALIIADWILMSGSPSN